MKNQRCQSARQVLLYLSALFIFIGSSHAESSTKRIKKMMRAYSYYPVFSSDKTSKKTPYSLYKGTRLKRSKLEALKTKVLQENPKLDIKTIAFPNAAGTLVLRHYNASKTRDSLTWSIVPLEDQKYYAILRFKDSRKKLNAKLILNKKPLASFKSSYCLTSFSLGKSELQQVSLKFEKPEQIEQLLAIDLLTKENFTKLAKSAKKDSKKAHSPDLKKLHPTIVKKMKQQAKDHYDIHTTTPAKMKEGQNGYVIITTKEKKRSLTALDAFIRHKKSRGFNIFLITEDDFGGGKGDRAAHNIRKWLKANYQKKKLLYALLIGNPIPKDGDIPYKNVGAYYKSEKHILDMGVAAYKAQEPKFFGGELPTDYFYVDLNGDWDLNKNGFIADRGDYGKGGIDGQPEIYVGRIPFYGLNHKEGNSRDVDNILERIIRYENDSRDLAWRHNMFYTGDTFERTGRFYNEFFAHSGAKINRNTHSDPLFLIPERDDQKQHNVIDAQNADKYGIVYYQEHGFPQGIGMMSTGGSSQLKDKYPSVYYLGGCDIASPEHSNNVSYALLRNSGIAVYGGTRSVSSQAQNRWLKHNQFYSHLYFGKSTGEALWSKRALESKDRTIGGTNFLINLLGDPSIVPMPQTYGEELSIAPGFKVRLQATVGTTDLPSVDFEIRNNSKSTQEYRIKASKKLKFSTSQFSLGPNSFKKLTLSILNPEKLPLGKHKLSFTVKGSKKIKGKKNSKRQSISVLVEPKKLIHEESFDNALTYLDRERKAVAVSAEDSLVKGVIGKAVLLKQHSAKLKFPHWENRADYTISFSQKISSVSDQGILNIGSIQLSLKDLKLVVKLQPNRWSYQKEKALTLVGPLCKKKLWQNITLTYRRATNKFIIRVGDEKTEHQLHYSFHSTFPIKELYFPGKAGTKIAFDNLKVFNYVLNKKERSIVHSRFFTKPLLPYNGGKVQPKKLKLLWAKVSAKKAYVQVAEDILFKKIIFKAKAKGSVELPPLQDKRTYYWRVNHPSAKKGTIKSAMVNSFTTDASFQPKTFNVGEIKLPIAPLGKSGYNKHLIHHIKDMVWEDRRSLKYSKLSGPAWLRIMDDGRLFTNFGPTKSNIGKNTFKVRITTVDGFSKTVSFTILVQ